MSRDTYRVAPSRLIPLLDILGPATPPCPACANPDSRLCTAATIAAATLTDGPDSIRGYPAANGITDADLWQITARVTDADPARQKLTRGGAARVLRTVYTVQEGHTVTQKTEKLPRRQLRDVERNQVAARAVELYNDGKSVRDVAVTLAAELNLSMSYGAAHRLLLLAGVEFRPRGGNTRGKS